MKVIRQTFKHYVRFLPLAITALLMGIIAQFSAMFIPKLMGMIVDFGLSDSSVQEGIFNPFLFLLEGRTNATVEMLTVLCVAFVLLLLIKHISLYGRNNINQFNGMNFNRTLRVNGVKKYWAMDKSLPTGILFTTLNNDTVNIKEMYVTVLPQLVDHSFIVILSFVLMTTININLLIVPLIATPFIIFFYFLYMKAARKVTVRARTCFVDLNYAIEENFANFPLVKQYGREDYESIVFRGYSRRHMDSNINVNKVSTRFTFIFNIIKALTYVATIAVGTVLAVNKVISLGNFLEFVTYTYLILDGINNFMTVCFNFSTMSASGNRYVDFIENAVVASIGGDKLIGSKPSVAIKNVSIVKDDIALLRDITIDIPYGKIIGITGNEGSGKTLLLKAINAMSGITSGDILFNDISIKQVSFTSLHNTISHLFEEGMLIVGTIKDNITYGSEGVSQEFLDKCVIASGLSEQLWELDNGLQTSVNNVADISIQLLQSINICRALVYCKDIYLFDEPFKNFNSESYDKVIRSTLHLCKGKTVILSSTDSHVLKFCDEIICLSEGVVVERGTHKELKASKGEYYKIIRTSRLKEE